MYLPPKTSKKRMKAAEDARKNRADIVKALSRGQVSRRDLIKWGLITAGGALAYRSGLDPLASSARADSAVPTGAPPSPVPPGLEFTQPLPLLEVLTPIPVSALDPAPTVEANTTFNAAKGIGPVEGRPPGPDWAHQRFQEFLPVEAYDVTTRPAVGVRFHP